MSSCNPTPPFPPLPIYTLTTPDQMGKGNKHHRFCPHCSSSILIDFANSDVVAQRPFLAMNARLFEGVDLGRAKFEFYDGWSGIEPGYDRGLAKRAQKDTGKGEM